MDSLLVVIGAFIVYAIIKKELLPAIVALIFFLPYLLLFKMDLFQINLLYKIIIFVIVFGGSVFLYLTYNRQVGRK
ncbi:hypothetical protein BBF96_06060 [Anoxybacter fermentans]|uniref:Uncharacterized protein n=1 Tax=Anoxybacter fermentans TaxID=1323375 RepID=A0A3Q9HQ20_9FIRM|nr:hypothetical protein [Anoxybacter fermentans]AZR72996.1 hypothetical protein BBF96_06060 [Anoxybacter fermentans]